ncbi:MAG TPA: hypothetical protein VG713_12690 [Pirellulales bacterium]|nr:hypothetical protein [Pirellulales bacterium]
MSDDELDHRIATAIINLRFVRFRYVRNSAEGLLRLEAADQFMEINSHGGDVQITGRLILPQDKFLVEAFVPHIDGVASASCNIQIVGLASQCGDSRLGGANNTHPRDEPFAA